MKKPATPSAPAAVVVSPPEPVANDAAQKDEESIDVSVGSVPPDTAELKRRKILFNPSAGEVHRREQGSPWRVGPDGEIRQGNQKAQEEQAEKRRWGLAKQVQEGLIHSYGINYGVAELAALLKEGLALRSQGKTELSPTEVVYVQLLVASEKYDLKQVVLLLDRFPKGRNAGGENAQKGKA
ncbi:hypothetical protein Poli38472_004021 [Pythium oligandrum]|uniref:Uncharacterized protein n=1 Tax=Pythium oligandrum TaxID=41045 RepID=A0A8K1FKN7_PYTOL|nr:hypothetical protein Poli38472_004021 [Pythium oligandrum]|eukprot:TMW66256.1 hypothetical protein Poli38472_004021 [Pythium oligandrum]